MVLNFVDANKNLEKKAGNIDKPEQIDLNEIELNGLVDLELDEFEMEELEELEADISEAAADCNQDYVGNSLQMLINQISTIELLSAEEELELGRIIADGGIRAQKARNRLVETNLRLVLHIAKRYIGRGVDMDDMVTMGIEGLIRAAEKYDYKKGYRFSTYATWWIKQSIARGITDEGSLVRVPIHMNDIISKVKRAQKEYFQQHGEEPSVHEIVSITGIEEERVQAALDAMYNIVSMDAKINDDGESTLQEILGDDTAVDPLDNSVAEALKASITAVLSLLDPKEAAVLKLRYGIDGCIPMTLEQIAALPEFGVSRERIRQIESKALRTIRNTPFLSAQLKDFAS